MAFRSLLDSVKNFFGPNNSFFNGPRAEEETTDRTGSTADAGQYMQAQQSTPQQNPQGYTQPTYDAQPQQTAYQAPTYQPPQQMPYTQPAYQQSPYAAQPYQQQPQPAQPQQQVYSTSPL